MKRITASRAAERREYTNRWVAYLAAHPLDQIAIALHGFDEDAILAAIPDSPRFKGVLWQGAIIGYSDQIHHRNKTDHGRLLDERWWLATNLASHTFIEEHKGWARENGFLLPIQADSEGRWGAGNQGLTTPEFMKARAG